MELQHPIHNVENSLNSGTSGGVTSVDEGDNVLDGGEKKAQARGKTKPQQKMDSKNKRRKGEQK